MAGIYLHVPFCKTRCIYCDFYSTTMTDQKKHYVDALCKELEQRKSYLKEEPIETIYFGGGTPSQLTSDEFNVIFETIQKLYDIENCKEITLEANPDDLKPEYIAELSKLPFNRISIGIQTFNDRTLKLLKRRHTAEQAIEAVANCRKAGFKNISIDLMYGLPDETDESWLSDLRQAISLNVDHVSAYHLIYEEGTALWKMRDSHKVEETDEEHSLSFFASMIDELAKAGYEHYEISNFCKPGFHSRHNSSYWIGSIYLGCGPSAHSYNGTNRQWNTASLKDYTKGIENNTPYFEIEEFNIQTRYNDLIITSLRTIWGLSLDKVENEFGRERLEYCLSNAQQYLITGKLEVRENVLYITEKGVFVSDGIMSDLLWVED